MNIQSGDILFVWDIPRYLMDYMDWLTGSPPCHHVATVVDISGKNWVVEAYPPKVRKMPLEDYLPELKKWSVNKIHPSRDMRVEIGRCSAFDLKNKELIKEEVMSWIGKDYSLFKHWFYGKGINCSSLIALGLLNTELFEQKDFPAYKFRVRPIHKIRPIDVRLVLYKYHTSFHLVDYNE